MYKRFLNRFNSAIALCLIISFVGCSMDFNGIAKNSVTFDSVKSVVSTVIDEEMDCIKENLEPEVQAGIEGEYTKGKPLTGREIVELTTMEESGNDYIMFCYEVEGSTSSSASESVLDYARDMIPEKDYRMLVSKAAEVENRLNELGAEIVKGIPTDQQEAFYQDLKTLVVRTVVLLTAGIVYSVMPKTVFWGKVSAAAAISVGAGMVAISVMTIYEYFKFGNLNTDGSTKTFEDWFRDILNDSKAEFALTTAVTTLGNSLDKGPVVTGIIMCAFAVFKAVDMIRIMLKTYNIRA